MEVYLDATDAIVGRLASYAAKQALLGNSVVVVNCEKAVLSGSPDYTHEKYYKRIFETGQVTKGPFISRMPERFLRRIIRGMLPHKRARGREAFKRVMCYRGLPDEFKDKPIMRVPKADFTKLPVLKYIRLGELCSKLGGRV